MRAYGVVALGWSGAGVVAAGGELGVVGVGDDAAGAGAGVVTVWVTVCVGCVVVSDGVVVVVTVVVVVRGCVARPDDPLDPPQNVVPCPGWATDPPAITSGTV